MALGGPCEEPLIKNSYRLEPDAENVTDEPAQMTLLVEQDIVGTGKALTVNVRDGNPVFEQPVIVSIPVTVIVCPFVNAKLLNVLVVVAKPCEAPFTKNSYLCAPTAVKLTAVPEQIILSASELFSKTLGNGFTLMV